MNENLPIVLIEGLLVLGGALLFGWWQLRSIRRDQQKAAAERAARQAATDAAANAASTEQRASADSR
jgi:hypothetical protein